MLPKKLAQEGKKGFYEGDVAQHIVEAVANYGGCLSLDDLEKHTSTYEQPIYTDYKGVRLWEIPPNGQGIVALMALNILEDYDLKAMGHNSTQYLHTLIEAVKLSFADAITYVADPTKVKVPIEQMLNKVYASSRRKLIKPDRSTNDVNPGNLTFGTDTVYFTATDKEGNACSFINSNFMGFGTGIVPEKCGFTLQNRGYDFSLDPNHLNCIAPNKRPYHTIIPAMLTDTHTGELLASYGVMGGYMQPQGHVQVLLNMLEFGMNPQTALNQPRFLIGGGHWGAVGPVSVEDGISEDIVKELRSKGHEISTVTGHNRSVFGRGHIITRGAWWTTENDVVKDTSLWWAGTDPRADGMAIGY